MPGGGGLVALRRKPLRIAGGPDQSSIQVPFHSTQIQTQMYKALQAATAAATGDLEKAKLLMLYGTAVGTEFELDYTEKGKKVSTTKVKTFNNNVDEDEKKKESKPRGKRGSGFDEVDWWFHPTIDPDLIYQYAYTFYHRHSDTSQHQHQKGDGGYWRQKGLEYAQTLLQLMPNHAGALQLLQAHFNK